MNYAAVTSPSYTTLPLSLLVPSTTNPRRTFNPEKLVELAKSIAAHGMIQPITARPKGDRFEIVAGERRYLAAQIAEQQDVPVCIRELSDDQALEVQIVENAQRQDVHPYEEAAGYQRLLERPGYDVASLAAKCGKSESHVYSRLSLLSLIPEAVEAFQHERITATHANLLARLTPEQQEKAFPQCWRKDYRDNEEHLLAARFLSAWIRQNLYLPLVSAPFDRNDAALFPQAGACAACPKRTGYNAALFCDFEADEQCLNAACYQSKIEAHIERELAADGDLIPIEAGYRPAAEQRVGSVPIRDIWVLKEDSPRCETAGRGIVVYGHRVGTAMAVCTAEACPVHNYEVAESLKARARAEQHAAEARARAEEAARNAPEPSPEEAEEARENAAAELAGQERLQAQDREDASRIEQENQQRREQMEADQQKHIAEAEAATKRRAAEQKKRDARFHRLLKQVPEVLTPAQLRLLLIALVHVEDFGRLLGDAAEHVAGVNADEPRGADEVMHEAIGKLTDARTSRFAVSFALACHRGIPYPDQTDLLAEAEAVFAQPSAPAGEDELAEPETKKRRKA